MRPSVFPRLAVASLARSGMAAALALGVVAAHAVSISPVLVELSPGHRVSSITFRNPGASTVVFQTRVMAWTQIDGVDQYAPSQALIVAPPIAEIAPGGTQIFRVALRGPATGREQAYRLVFEDASAAAPAASGEVAMALRINHDLPVFVAPAGQPAANLRIGPCTGNAAAACVRLDNRGDRYALVRTLTIERGTQSTQLKVNARILAGAWKQWPIQVPAGAGGAIKVSAHTSAGVIGGELHASR